MFKKKPAEAVQSKSDNPRLFFVGLVCVILLYIYRALLLSSSSSKSKKKKKEEMVVVDKTRKISAEEVRKHNSVDDLWIIIDKKVYDVTEYAEEHPGGVAAIAKNAGGDASKGFRGPQHPSRVFDIVDDYMIGVLEEKK
jgi:cytochrome b involved in lipid metabolism